MFSGKFSQWELHRHLWV